MSLPNQLKSARMTNATTCDTVPSNMSALEQAISDILGVPIDTNILNKLFQVDAAGLKKLLLQDLAGDPAAAGELARNGSQLKFHDGTAVRTVFTSANEKRVVKFIDQTTYSGLVPDSALYFPVLSGETWVVDATIFYSAAVANGFGAYLVPTITAGQQWTFGALAGGQSSGGPSAFPTTYARGLINPNQVHALGGTVGAGADVSVALIRGTYFIQGASCNIQFYFTTASAALGFPVTVFHGSYMVGKRV